MLSGGFSLRSLRMANVIADQCTLSGAWDAARAIDRVDAELVSRAKSGDAAAEEALYRRHVAYVAGLVGRLVGHVQETEDCVQETFAIALARLRSLREGDAVRAWLARIAVNLVRRRFRRRKLLNFVGLDDPRGRPPERFVWTGASPDVHAELTLLWSALERLPIEQRLAWSLRHVEGHELAEVATACECSLATAKRRIAAAESSLRLGGST
jgi:RNA polymerase sigma-70 factor, ECF subfamily